MRKLSSITPGVCLAMVLLSPCAAPAARAAVAYSYRTDSAAYTAGPAEPVVVTVYLREMVTGSTPSALAPGGSGGLVRAGVQLVRVGSPPPSPTVITDAAGNTVAGASNPLVFNSPADFAKSVTPTLATLAEATEGTIFVPGVPTGATGVREALLGTFTLTTGSAAGQVTNFVVTDRDNYGAAADTVLGNGTVIDVAGGTSPTPMSISVTVIPEPAAAAVGAVSVAAALARRRRRRTNGGRSARAGRRGDGAVLASTVDRTPDRAGARAAHPDRG